jgi:putative aminopeptidase FrvX
MTPRASFLLAGIAFGIAFGIAAQPAALAAQSPMQQLLGTWQQLAAPTGHEARAVRALAATMDGWQQDAAGNLILRRGEGRPRRVVACGLDRPGFAVTQITDDGFLRLHRVGSSAGYALFDQAHEAQQVNIFTATDIVPGVIAVANGHFAQQHRADSLVVTADDLWLDVGARNRAEVERLGIRVLDPVERRVPAWTYAGGVAGNAMGTRAGCAAVAAASRGNVLRGETVFVMSTQSIFGWAGLGAAITRLGGADEVTVVASGRAVAEVRWVRAGGAGAPNAGLYASAKVDSIRMLHPAVRYAGSLVESIDESAVGRLLTEVVNAGGVDRFSLPAAPWVSAPMSSFAPLLPRTDGQSAIAAQLKMLADLPGVPHDEWRVRDAIHSAMPAWARNVAVVDSAGNLIVGMGPERDTLLFIAHLDEVAYDVVSIARDGLVTLRARGGAVASAWEGTPALLHLARREGAAPLASIPGIFVPRETARLKRPDRMTAWFGMDSATLVAQGVRVGDGVTSYKDAVRLAGSRFTGRAMDDRAGSLALLRALDVMNPATLTRRVLFVWSTAEEVGLEGAAALAARIGSSVQRVHSIDTFVSSDTPLESPHFAFAPLGDGPVLRGSESSSMVPPDAKGEVMAIAERAGIPLQIGLTQGGTDGTAFTYYGAPNVPLSWPGRYSHAPGEVLDLRDLEKLSALIAALASAPR